MTPEHDWPLYSQLPAATHGGRSAWGVFGDEDVVGTLNMIDEAQVLASSRLVKSGKVFSLNAPLDVPSPPLAVGRKALQHKVIRGEPGDFTDLDDVVDSYYPQASSLWDNRISAVAADNFSVEVWPPDLSQAAQPFGFLRRILIGQFGMALGELWDLRELAMDCAHDTVYECMVVSAPWHLPGGVGSPANALAIK